MTRSESPDERQAKMLAGFLRWLISTITTADSDDPLLRHLRSAAQVALDTSELIAAIAWCHICSVDGHTAEEHFVTPLVEADQ